MSDSKTETTPGTMTSSMKSQIAGIVSAFLKDCDITYPHGIQVDNSFRDACYADARRRGFDMELLGKALDVGIAIADASYRYLDSYSTQIFIALWTALLTHIDGMYEVYSDGLNEFFDRFSNREPQRYEVLDQTVTMLRESSQHWGVVSANLIMTAEIDFLTSTIIDSAIEGMKIKSPGFPHFTRRMTGIARAYCFMVFPPNLDLKTWIQVVPDLMHYIEHTNDLLSFFKEELAGESVNYVSMSANFGGITKIEALQRLAHETAQYYQRGSRLLQSAPEAWEAYRAFTVGYVGFHALSIRYKLDQLQL